MKKLDTVYRVNKHCPQDYCPKCYSLLDYNAITDELVCGMCGFSVKFSEDEDNDNNIQYEKW